MSLDLSPLATILQRELVGSYFADSGPFAREFYPKHIEAMAATAKYKRCTIFGANRVGKTLGWVYALACFLTGKYPHWWVGRRFHKPILAWAAGEDMKLVRTSIQRYLIGARDGDLAVGGFVAREDIVSISWGPDDFARRIVIRSAFGGLSECEFKTYQMEQKAFQSGTVDVVLMDEEPKAFIYTEAVTRTATTRGLVLTGFTALQGVTPLIAHLLPQFADGEETDREESSHWYDFIGWDDIPEAHFPLAERKATMAGYLSHEIDARTKGIPRLGSGMVWNIDENTFLVPPFDVPISWPRWKAVDPGFQDPTAVLDFALDMETDSIYIVGEYRKNLTHLEVHAAHIKRGGGWIPCVIDPAGANIDDGEKIYELYRKALSNPCFRANKALTTGLMEVRDRLMDGRLFVFNTLRKWLGEYRTYVRDEKGRIMDRMDSNRKDKDGKQGDESHHFDLMACTRYGVLGKGHAVMRPRNWTDERDRMRPWQDGPQQQTSIDHGFFG